MQDFFDAYKEDVLYTIIVLIIAFLLRYVTITIYDYSLKRISKRYGTATDSGSLTWIRWILKTVWLVLAVFAILYIFLEVEYQSVVENNFIYTAIVSSLAIGTIIVSAMVNLWFKNIIHQYTVDSKDSTNLKFLRYVAIIIIYFIGFVAILYTFPSMRGIATGALGGAGVLTIIIGIASQEAFANIVGGIFIVAFKPFKVGDIIQISDGKEGLVTDITLRHIVIRDYDNKMIVIPNSNLNKDQIINYDLGDKRMCNRIELGISLDSDVKLAKNIMQKVCESHPLILDTRTSEMIDDGENLCRTAVTKLENTQVVVRVWAWAANFADSVKLRFDVLEEIKEQFDVEGIEMAYPYRAQIKKDKSSDNIVDEESIN